MIDILVVNLNCLIHTKNLLSDLSKQIYKDFKLTLVDQGSSEPGTENLLNSLINVKIIKNSKNEPLNSIWNQFVKNIKSDYFCILNNDIRIPSNFLLDVFGILHNNYNIGAVMHPTNHHNYSSTIAGTKFDILPRNKYRQGWDICMRREAWTEIPQDLNFYCGDDFIFEMMYSNGYEAAMAISSPIIHYLGQTRKSPYNKHMPERNPNQDIENYRKLGYKHHMIPPPEYTIVDYSQSRVDFIQDDFAIAREKINVS